MKFHREIDKSRTIRSVSLETFLRRHSRRLMHQSRKLITRLARRSNACLRIAIDFLGKNSHRDLLSRKCRRRR